MITILAAAEVVQVVSARPDRIAQTDLGDLQTMPSPVEPLTKHRDVAAVGIDVHEVGVEVAQSHRELFGHDWSQ